SSIRGRPVIDRGLVIAIGNAGVMTAINLRTGRRVWEREVGGFESPWVAGQYVYVLSRDSELVALDRLTGRILWVRSLPQWEDMEDREGRVVWTGPILASDRLIVASSSGLAYSVSPYTGQVMGAEELPDGIKIGPIVASNSIFLLSDNAELFAYR
ncbi:MAG: PQQ-binding-like beta-propeller repeat protein, partial [Rhodospirillales bacterium]|nr:PQQ-binding-like beta-propeller repeat protein [Rhodospirillales bacterium]